MPLASASIYDFAFELGTRVMLTTALHLQFEQKLKRSVGVVFKARCFPVLAVYVISAARQFVAMLL